jgi:hypothetical protein
LRVRRRQRSSLGGTLRRTSMKLNEGFLEAADLRAKSSTRGNGPLSLCCSRREGTKICSLSKLVCRLAPRNRRRYRCATRDAVRIHARIRRAPGR